MDTNHIIRALLQVAQTAYTLAENSEDDGEQITIAFRSDFEELSDALTLLDRLPEPDNPSYIFSGPAKAAQYLLHNAKPIQK